MQLVETLFPDIEPRYRTRVYFGLGDNGQLKIGLTSRRDGRRGGEMHFAELCSLAGDKRLEGCYHSKYATERIGRTEWFHLSDRLLLDLTVMCVQQDRSKSVEVLKRMMLARLRQAVA